MWSLISTGVPGFQVSLMPPAPLVSTIVRRAGRRGGAHAVHDPAHAVALVVVRARADDEHVLAAAGSRCCAACRRGPRARACEKPVTSVAGIVATVSPMSSAALPQPLPRVRAMSWRSTPVSRAMSAAASAAIANGSAAGSSRGLASVSDMHPLHIHQNNCYRKDKILLLPQNRYLLSRVICGSLSKLEEQNSVTTGIDHPESVICVNKMSWFLLK